jgi:hypothetical protein
MICQLPLADKWKKVKVALQQAMMTQSGSRYIALLFFNLGARWKWVVNATPRPIYSWEKDSVYSTGVLISP